MLWADPFQWDTDKINILDSKSSLTVSPRSHIMDGPRAPPVYNHIAILLDVSPSPQACSASIHHCCYGNTELPITCVSFQHSCYCSNKILCFTDMLKCSCSLSIPFRIKTRTPDIGTTLWTEWSQLVHGDDHFQLIIS